MNNRVICDAVNRRVLVWQCETLETARWTWFQDLLSLEPADVEFYPEVRYLHTKTSSLHITDTFFLSVFFLSLAWHPSFHLPGCFGSFSCLFELSPLWSSSHFASPLPQVKHGEVSVLRYCCARFICFQSHADFLIPSMYRVGLRRSVWILSHRKRTWNLDDDEQYIYG